MSGITRVSIYRNEYGGCSPEQCCVITLQPHSNRITFQSNVSDPTNSTEFVIYDAGLRDTIGYALSLWLEDGHPLCTFGMRFRDEETYRRWRRSVLFEDCDVSWHVVIELKGGEIITYVCIGQYPFPGELAEIISKTIAHRKNSPCSPFPDVFANANEQKALPYQ